MRDSMLFSATCAQYRKRVRAGSPDCFAPDALPALSRATHGARKSQFPGDPLAQVRASGRADYRWKTLAWAIRPPYTASAVYRLLPAAAACPHPGNPHPAWLAAPSASTRPTPAHATNTPRDAVRPLAMPCHLHATILAGRRAAACTPGTPRATRTLRARHKHATRTRLARHAHATCRAAAWRSRRRT